MTRSLLCLQSGPLNTSSGMAERNAGGKGRLRTPQLAHGSCHPGPGGREAMSTRLPTWKAVRATPRSKQKRE